MQKKTLSWRWFEIGLIGLIFLTYLYVAVSPANSLMRWFDSDDAFYYYKVAINFIGGHGFTFDGLNLTNGFQPLWMIICLLIFPLAKVNLILPLRALILVLAFLNGWTGVFLFRLLRRFVSSWTAAAAAVLWTFSTIIFNTVVKNGMETSLSVFCLAWLLYLAAQRLEEAASLGRFAAVGCVAGLTILARLDNVFVVMLLGIWFATGKWQHDLGRVFISDLALIFITGLFSYFLRMRTGFFYTVYSSPMVLLIGAGFILKPASLFLFKLYHPSEQRFSWNQLGRTVLAVTAPSFIIGLMWVGALKLKIFSTVPRSVLLIDWAVTLAGILVIRLVAPISKTGWTAEGREASASSWKLLLRRSIGYYLPVGFLLGSYLLFNQFYLGSAMPISGRIKYWWSTLTTVYGSGIKTLPGLIGIQKTGGPWQLVITCLNICRAELTRFINPGVASGIMWAGSLAVLLLVVILLASHWKWVKGLAEGLGIFALLAGLLSQIFSYTSTGYIHSRAWYWADETFFTILCLSIVLEAARLSLEHRKTNPRLWPVLVTLLSAILIVYFVGITVYDYPLVVPKAHQLDYLIETNDLQAATEPGSLIGMTGGGTFAYFIQDRSIVNLDGLINSPEYFESLSQEEGGQFLDRMGLNYVYGSKYMLNESEPYGPELAGHLEQVDWLNDWVLYRYLPTP
jgi:hypothetical protein